MNKATQEVFMYGCFLGFHFVKAHTQTITQAQRREDHFPIQCIHKQLKKRSSLSRTMGSVEKNR